ncbi:MAG: RNA-binding S4 domain-containing protein [Alphaproteobacteria bacterium]|nr:RNA-binding S4 domain-containing protein [Alphaproteobacteria bacterium]
MTDASLRLDKWLWYARFFKSRTLAAEVSAGGRLRIDHRVIDKAATAIRPGMVLTFPQVARIRVVRVVALGSRRGPPAEAAALYEDLTPQEPPLTAPARRPRGSGRPTKAARRAIDRLTQPD